MYDKQHAKSVLDDAYGHKLKPIVDQVSGKPGTNRCYITIRLVLLA